MSNIERQSIWNNALSLAKWDGATDAEADRKADDAVGYAEIEEKEREENERENPESCAV